ncbi:MAG: excinuclease ABC subunit UvrC [Rhodospirillales bacterium]|jgi:excinuclease ABC subunit C|nr:excinuclease ABC subunit UvrC [Rhodospirillales bacterium]MBT4038417.1 excinuclease ABC subunit UvrC [Rhodospirillales bacterium]MBT4625714.1 excinuclease ABC subunit UvrC [Rhodospirillales bacterium]MBT5352380.1 excinuclease ABC subunit UvrC [Rhodospirillales bacterium]MBT5519826.1 excinuclease ABC subunit UvrC [Rhodospirillales bacterium]
MVEQDQAADDSGKALKVLEDGKVDGGSVNSLAGIDVIRSYLTTLPNTPGVYRMISDAGKVLYVGKAKSLKKRVTSYTNLNNQSNRIRRMVSETATMEFVTTHTEAEALLLEANLIKRYAPRYNILLRDDKNFPQILVTDNHDFAQILKHRGAQKRKGEYFGPFASASAVNETLAFLQRVFLLRTCTDAVFEARTRPCLLYQIKRCSGPCDGRISQEAYAELVDQGRAFLSGRSNTIQQDLAAKMQQASDKQKYEEAAQYRDRIQALTRIQAHQDINLAGMPPTDVIAIHEDNGDFCIQIFFYRGGRNYGNRAYFPAHSRDETADAVLEAFLGQFYAQTTPPGQLLLSQDIPNRDLVSEALGIRAERRVHVRVPTRGDKRKLLAHAEANARAALSRRLAESATQRKLLDNLGATLELDGAPERIEVYDNSHVSGTDAVGAMIVAGPEGFVKNAYRKFNIKGSKHLTPLIEKPDEPHRPGLSDTAQEPYSAGDDFAMMREVLTRRFSRAMKEDPDRSMGQWPDLLLIDGGLGQLNATLLVLEELGIDDVAVAGVAKGPNRNAGRERVFQRGKSPLSLEARDPVLYFIQRLRDEAHRFAIGTHRAKRGKSTQKSTLDEIPGVGGKRKKALLHHFGAASSVAEAGREDLAVVDGISAAMASKIYDWFHPHG